MSSPSIDSICGEMSGFLAGEIDNIKTLDVDGTEYSVDCARMVDGFVVVTLHPPGTDAPFNLEFEVNGQGS